MRKSLKEWLPSIGRGWVFVIVGLMFGTMGILQELSRSGLTMPAVLVQTAVPAWGWYLLSVLGITIGSFNAFHRVRVERDYQEDDQQAV